MVLIEKIALVTGAASGVGLGLATAQRLAQRGTTALLSDFDAGATQL